MTEKMKFETKDLTQENIAKIGQLFPEVLTEAKDGNGILKKVINFDKLRQILSDSAIDNRETYDFTWVGKKQAILEAATPIRKTLRPCKEESVNWENTQNLYIEGDNSQILKCLQESYLKKIDIIYIDPPYNTGNNLIYKNNFYQDEDEYAEDANLIDDDGFVLATNSRSNARFHSDWCSMMYSRLVLARNLLSEKGIIVLTIDDNEIENITSIMNEIFGESNHLATIIIKNNPSGRSTVTGASISHEYALFYGANNDVKLGRLGRTDEQIARYKEEDEKGKFEWVNFRKHGGYKEDAPSMYYPIFIKKDGSSFRIPKLKWDEKRKEYEILDALANDEVASYPIDENGRARRWKWGLERALKEKGDMTIRQDRNKEFAVYIKARMKDEGMLPLTVWDDKKYSSTEYGTNLLTHLMGNKYFDYPKSLYAVLDCLRISSSNTNATVLDFFSGSATTAHAVMQMNVEDGGKRKFIMAQLPEPCEKTSEAYKAGYKNICEIGKERIRRAAKQIKEEHPESNFDGGFRVFKLADSNMKDVYYNPSEYTQDLLDKMTSNIKEDRNDMDLLYGCMLEWGLPLSYPHTSEKVGSFTIHTVNNGDLAACFDENITEDVIRHIAAKKPLRVVFRDASFADSPAKINVEELFKLLSPDTKVKVI